MIEDKSSSFWRHQLAKQELKKHIVSNFKRERSDIKACSTDSVLNNKHFYGKKVCIKCTPKTSSRSLFSFSKQLKKAKTYKKLFLK